MSKPVVLLAKTRLISLTLLELSSIAATTLYARDPTDVPLVGTCLKRDRPIYRGIGQEAELTKCQYT